MTFKRLLFPVLSISLAVICSGCRLSKEEVVGSYKVHDEGASSKSAIDLDSDGTFDMYRTVNFGESDGSINLYQSQDTEQYPSISGSGTWEVENRFLLSPLIRLKLNTGSNLYLFALFPVRHDGFDCFEVRHDHNKEYWCKSN